MRAVIFLFIFLFVQSEGCTEFSDNCQLCLQECRYYHLISSETVCSESRPFETRYEITSCEDEREPSTPSQPQTTIPADSPEFSNSFITSTPAPVQSPGVGNPKTLTSPPTTTTEPTDTIQSPIEEIPTTIEPPTSTVQPTTDGSQDNNPTSVPAEGTDQELDEQNTTSDPVARNDTEARRKNSIPHSRRSILDSLGGSTTERARERISITYCNELKILNSTLKKVNRLEAKRILNRMKMNPMWNYKANCTELLRIRREVRHKRWPIPAALELRDKEPFGCDNITDCVDKNAIILDGFRIVDKLMWCPPPPPTPAPAEASSSLHVYEILFWLVMTVIIIIVGVIMFKKFGTGRIGRARQVPETLGLISLEASTFL